MVRRPQREDRVPSSRGSGSTATEKISLLTLMEKICIVLLLLGSNLGDRARAIQQREETLWPRLLYSTVVASNIGKYIAAR